MPASALETLILPGRVPGYQPAMLDELTAAGEVVWSGAGGLPGGDGWVALAPADTAPLLLPGPGEITLTPLHEAVLAALDGGGGMFFRMLADRAAALLPDGARGEATDAAVAAAIWDLVWAGRITNDTLAALRTVLGTGRPAAGGGPASSAPARRAAAAARRPWVPGGEFRPPGDAVPDRAAHGHRALVAGAARRPGRDPAAARAGPDAAGPARDPDPRRGRRGTGAGRLRRDLPGAAGHGGRGPVPPRLLRGGTGRRAVRPARRGGPDARAGRGGRPRRNPRRSVGAGRRRRVRAGTPPVFSATTTTRRQPPA